MIDNPSPGGTYVAFIFVMMFVAVAVPVVLRILRRISGIPLFVVFAVCALIIVLQLLLVHAAFNTRYEFKDGQLHMKSGVFANMTVPVSEITEFQKVEMIGKVLGRGLGSKGIANRFKNGLSFKHEDVTVYISPTDIDSFAAELGKPLKAK